jgi:hypothetical protein
MRTLLILLSLSIFIFSCKQKTSERTSYTLIDLSWSNGWTKTMSVFIDSSKNVNIAVRDVSSPKNSTV